MFKWISKIFMFDVEDPKMRLIAVLSIIVVGIGTLTASIIAIIFSLGAVKEPGKKAGFEGPLGIKIEVARLEQKIDSLTKQVTAARSSEPQIVLAPMRVDTTPFMVSYFEKNPEAMKAYSKWLAENWEDRMVPVKHDDFPGLDPDRMKQLRDWFKKNYPDRFPNPGGR